ncbi:MAG: cytochrome c [Gammaproteobacteria bacterium]|nr:cytochrome c [Gammaproteobacteria bacterium]
MKTIIGTLLLATVFAILMTLLVIYTGAFNVATTWEDPAPVSWVLETTRENSIETRAASIVVPPTKGDKQIDSGFRSYREMCAMCHTPPGGTDSPITKGMNPSPPDLAKSAEHMSAAELFWATKNGIRMTGMPAWGVTHKDGELWDIIAFVKKLPGMSKEAYLALDARLEKGHDHAGGGHGHGDDSHGDSEPQKNDDHAHEHDDDGHAH